jgi:hypothetical protein
MDTKNLQTLTEVAGDLFFAGAEKHDYSTPLGEFLKGLEIDSFGDVHVNTDDGKLELKKPVLTQLVKDRLGGSPAIVNDKDLSPATKLAYMGDKAAALPNNEVVVRQSANNIDAVLSQAYQFIDNGTMLQAIMQAAGTNGIPPLDELYVHHHWSDPGARNVFLRIVSPQNWAYKNGEDYIAAVAFSNNELGKGSLEIQPALARVACFNYTLAESVINMEHRYTDRDEVVQAIIKGLTLVNDHAELMFEQQQQHKAAVFSNPEAVFALIADRLGFPTAVQEKAMDYWSTEGEDPSLYGIREAVTFGVQGATNVKGSRRKPKWDIRTEIEHEIWTWTKGIFEVHTNGDDINEWVNASELVSKRKAVAELRKHDWGAAADTVAVMEADDYR